MSLQSWPWWSVEWRLGLYVGHSWTHHLFMELAFGFQFNPSVVSRVEVRVYAGKSLTDHDFMELAYN